MPGSHRLPPSALGPTEYPRQARMSQPNAHKLRVAGTGVQRAAYASLLEGVPELQLDPHKGCVVLLFTDSWREELSTAHKSGLADVAGFVLMHSGSPEELTAAYRAGIQVFVSGSDDISVLIEAVARAEEHRPFLSPILIPIVLDAVTSREGCQRLLTQEEALLLRLTERQREIASAAAAGLANKQIGRALALTEAGVKYHLTRIYERLGIEGRGDLQGFKPYLLSNASSPQRPGKGERITR